MNSETTNQQYTHYFAPFGFKRNKPDDYIKARLTGKIYEIGEHQEYNKHKVIEIIDEYSQIHDAFEDELKLIHY
jgi:hypothetical protein